MAGRLAAVPEESMDGSTAAYPPRSPYRDLIRRVAVSGTQIRCTLFSHSQSGHHSGSSYSSDSGTSNSYPSNNSGCSSRSASAAAADFGTQELKMIARRMVSDGYTQRMVQAFSSCASPGSAALGYNGDPDYALNNWFSGLQQPFDMVPATPTHVCSDDQDRVLETWFFELDVGWVLQIRQEHDSQWQLRLQNNSGSSLQDLVERWIRGLAVIVHSIIELQSTRQEMTAVKRFCEASIFKMHVFVDAMDPAWNSLAIRFGDASIPSWKAENLRSLLDMYICVRKAMDIMEYSEEHSKLVHFPLLYLSLAAYKLKKAISGTMNKVMTLAELEDDYSWAIEIPRGGGEVHRNTRWIADCILALGEADAKPFFVSIIGSTSLLYDSSTRLSDVRYDTIRYLKGLLVRKSELCPDPSLRYLFLLNNFYFVAQMGELCQPENDWQVKPECERCMYSYLDVSWGHVLSCIPSHFPGPLHRLMNTDPLVKFQSAFDKTYQAQKFWKVPDPRLRDVLRRAINERVVSSYRDYLNEHPELAEQVGRRNNTPNVLEEMLGELFEG